MMIRRFGRPKALAGWRIESSARITQRFAIAYNADADLVRRALDSHNADHCNNIDFADRILKFVSTQNRAQKLLNLAL